MPAKIMQKIIKVTIPSALLLIYYFFSQVFVREKIGIENINLLNLIALIDFAILPIITISLTVVIKRYIYPQSYRKTFFISMLPGFIFSIDFSYGWFAMGHGYGLINYLAYAVTWGLWIFLIVALLSGLIGLLIDFIWNKISGSVY